MKPMNRMLLIGASLTALSGCLGQEIGHEINNSGFGTATMNNTMVQTGQRSFVIDMSHRFAEEVPSTVNFAFNSDRLDGTARAALDQQASWIRQFPEVTFRVYGHTDLVGSPDYNKSLGLRRAQAVVAYLASQGIDRSRLEAVVSYGETQPLIVTENRELQNRRTVTEVSGLVTKHPSDLNGKYAALIFREYLVSAEPKHPQNTQITTQTNPSGG
jgi:peptidoglycan-associated lipoprotein